MREAILWEEVGKSVVRCNICQWRCVINPGKLGLCRSRQNLGGILHLLNYGEISSAAADPIEKKPLFHFHPASQVFSLGGWGCNFRCRHCQNWQISQRTQAEAGCRSYQLSPEDAVNLTLQRNCSGIAWTYNEPGIWLEYTLDTAKLAKEKNLYTVYVTNGYLTEAALDTIGPYLDAWRVDLKGFSDKLYRGLAKVTEWRPILEVAKRAKDKWGMHVEVVTNIIPTLNDDDEQLEAIAAWICSELGELTPWHLTRFYPNHQIQNVLPTPVSTIERARDIGRRAGLRFVYVGNIPGHEGENTYCYSCGCVVVERTGYRTGVVGLDGAKCRYCKAELNFRI